MKTKIISANIPIAFKGVETDPVTLAACYLNWIAYPADSAQRRAERFVSSVRALPYKAQGKHLPPELKGIKIERIEGAISDAMKNVRKRYLARWMYYKIVGADADYPLPISISRACDLVSDPDATKDENEGAIDDNSETQNIRRLWYQTLPALPMILALPQPKESAREWLTHPEWVMEAVSRAHYYVGEVSSNFEPTEILCPVFTLQD